LSFLFFERKKKKVVCSAQLCSFSEMAITFTLVHDHGYVLAVVVLYFLVNFFLGNLVNRARGKYKIPLPNLYANGAMFLKVVMMMPFCVCVCFFVSLSMMLCCLLFHFRGRQDGKVDENELKNRGDAFNKVQRGHQHLFESISDAHALLFTAAIQYPFHSACAGSVLVVCFVFILSIASQVLHTPLDPFFTALATASNPV
jgi:hypothetical protein